MKRRFAEKALHHEDMMSQSGGDQRRGREAAGVGVSLRSVCVS